MYHTRSKKVRQKQGFFNNPAYPIFCATKTYMHPCGPEA